MKLKMPTKKVFHLSGSLNCIQLLLLLGVLNSVLVMKIKVQIRNNSEYTLKTIQSASVGLFVS